jgi:hypothetical protein
MKAKLFLSLALVLSICTLSMLVHRANAETFTTGIFGEKATTPCRLVDIDGDTYFVAQPNGLYYGAGDELTAILSPELVAQSKGKSPGVNKGVAARIKPFRKTAFKATAGPEGMHVSVDLTSGRMVFGKGIKYDILNRNLEVIFEEGQIEIPRARGGGKTGTDVYTFSTGSKITSGKKKGDLILRGITYSSK